MAHNFPFELDVFQKEAICHLEQVCPLAAVCAERYTRNDSSVADVMHNQLRRQGITYYKCLYWTLRLQRIACSTLQGVV